MAEVEKYVQDMITENKVVMFSKGWCPYCKMAKSVLDETFGKGTWKEIDIEKGGCPPGPQIQSYMKKETGASSVPRVFINGKFIGGGSETKALHEQGLLKAKLNE